MFLKLFCVLNLVLIVTAKISINVNVDQDKNITLTHSGIQVNLVTEEDLKSFNLEPRSLIPAVKSYLGKKPSDVYLTSPTPWGDLYKRFAWEQVKRVLSIKSIRIKSLTKTPVVVLSQDFENTSNNTIKVNTGIIHTVENTITTSWSKEHEFTVAQSVEYEFNVNFAKVTGSTSLSFTTLWGVSEEKTKTETVGTNSGMETDLQPGQAVTAVLSASAGNLEVEVVHKAYLRGNLAVNYRKAYNGHHFWGPPIQDVMNNAGLVNEVTSIQTLTFGFHEDASLKVYDKKTGLPL